MQEELVLKNYVLKIASICILVLYIRGLVSLLSYSCVAPLKSKRDPHMVEDYRSLYNIIDLASLSVQLMIYYKID